MGKSLKGTKSHDNLKGAFAGESQANRRYLYFARRADIEGFPDIGGLFRDTSEAETGHAFGHLDFLKEVGDPATGVPIGNTEANLKSAVEGETYEYTQMYPGMAKTARDEGFAELAEWFETLAKAERSHANRFTKGLDSLKQAEKSLLSASASAKGGLGMAWLTLCAFRSCIPDSQETMKHCEWSEPDQSHRSRAAPERDAAHL